MLSLQQTVRRLAAHVPSALAAPGAVTRIETIADALPAAITDCLCFEVGLTTINLGESIGPRLALECKFAETRRIDRPRWDRLMDHLVARGWCSPVCRDALFEWPGASVERLSHRVLPATVFRKISHFELLLEPGTPPEARAYRFSVVT